LGGGIAYAVVETAHLYHPWRCQNPNTPTRKEVNPMLTRLRTLAIPTLAAVAALVVETAPRVHF